jgi:hypothetical protein
MILIAFKSICLQDIFWYLDFLDKLSQTEHGSVIATFNIVFKTKWLPLKVYLQFAN